MTRYNVGDLIEYTRKDGDKRSIGSILRVVNIHSTGFIAEEVYKDTGLKSSWKWHETHKFTPKDIIASSTDPVINKIRYLQRKFENRKGVSYA